MRKRLVAGNWKMNMDPYKAAEFAGELSKKLNTENCDVVFCVPAIDVIPVINALKDTQIETGAQNMYFQDSGAFTGEISPLMLTGVGLRYVILGHSERRQYFGETDEIVNKKVKKALEHKLIPIVCVGESLEQRDLAITTELIRIQTKIAFSGITQEAAASVVVAYEPIWAIGTGKTASKEQAEEACAAIRCVLTEIYNEETAEKIRILYGGSVNAKNAAELFSMENIDGGLVGGASIKMEFADIVNC